MPLFKKIVKKFQLALPFYQIFGIIKYVLRAQEKKSPLGGIGRRAAFRSLFWQQSEGSTPLVGMNESGVRQAKACLLFSRVKECASV